jgi:hypothetical protein
MTSWIENIYSLLEKGNTGEAINILFRNLNQLFVGGYFKAANKALKIINVGRLDSNLLVALLSITKPAEEHLPYRPLLVEKIRTRLQKLAPDRVDRLMKNRD